MKLIIVRHGTATPESVDPEKPLSDRGKSEVQKVANFLKRTRTKVDVVWHSTKKRAIETAAILAEAAGAQQLETVEEIGPNDEIGALMKKIKKFSSTYAEKTLMIVGHLPFLAQLASSLMTGSCYDLVGFPTAGVVCLDQSGGHRWRLEWMVIPAILSQS